MGHKAGTNQFRVGTVQVKDGQTTRYAYWFCPRCNWLHGVPIDIANDLGAKWGWNGSYENPTLTPSVLSKHADKTECHCFIQNNQINFCGDTPPSASGEVFGGRTVPLPSLPTWFTDEEDQDSSEGP